MIKCQRSQAAIVTGTGKYCSPMCAATARALARRLDRSEYLQTGQLSLSDPHKHRV